MYKYPEAKEQLSLAVKESYALYKSSGARSSKKLSPIHQYISRVAVSAAKSPIEVRSMDSGGELSVQGAYYPKKVDIVLCGKGGAPLLGVGVKFVTSNFRQNANNYFEHMLGEVANLQSAAFPYAQFLILRPITPYLKKDGTHSKDEHLDYGDIEKYVKLISSSKSVHRPMAIWIAWASIKSDGTVSIHSCNDVIKHSIPGLDIDRLLGYQQFVEAIRAAS